MTTERPKIVIIKGQRFTSRQELAENPRAMRDVAQELIEVADFQLTCLPKIIGVVQQFELSTVNGFAEEGIWTRIVGAVCVEEESDGGSVEIIEV